AAGVWNRRASYSRPPWATCSRATISAWSPTSASDPPADGSLEAKAGVTFGAGCGRRGRAAPPRRTAPRGPENDAPAEGVAERDDRVRQQRERQDRTESDEAPPDLLGTALVDE